MQPTTRFHQGITNSILQEAALISHHPEAFHPANGLFNMDSDGGNTTIGGFFRRGEFPATRFLFGLHNRDVGQDEPLEAHLLIEITSGWSVSSRNHHTFSRFQASIHERLHGARRALTPCAGPVCVRYAPRFGPTAAVNSLDLPRGMLSDCQALERKCLARKTIWPIW